MSKFPKIRNERWVQPRAGRPLVAILDANRPEDGWIAWIDSPAVDMSGAAYDDAVARAKLMTQAPDMARELAYVLDFLRLTNAQSTFVARIDRLLVNAGWFNE